MKKILLLLTFFVSSVCAADTPAPMTLSFVPAKPVIFASETPVSGLYACGRAIASTINHAGLLTAGCWYFGKTLSIASLSHKESIAALAVGLGIYKGIRRYLVGRNNPEFLKGIIDNTSPLALGVLGGSCWSSSSVK